MRPTQHPSNNDVLAAPPGVDIDDCKALAITRVLFPPGMPHPPVHIGVDGVQGQPW